MSSNWNSVGEAYKPDSSVGGMMGKGEGYNVFSHNCNDVTASMPNSSVDATTTFGVSTGIEPKNGHLSVGERWRIISLYYNQNISPSVIAVSIDCTPRTVRNIVRLYDETGDVIEREGRGCPSLGNDNVLILRQLFYRHPTESSAIIADRFFRITNQYTASRTVRYHRRRLGFHPVYT
ncbi:unnamed protein product [Didymodactylos carnosus]|uniref:Uncharacterized protein n=1 Tax=Didymodactylos carnosus TaxID=1234261 RepID=A0A8S2EU66_9BILA|nr:unnamed protein product [Didymodactylos carnosus]CAF4049242.1 unnamed protein product [Didymodactylos carnosus]